MTMTASEMLKKLPEAFDADAAGSTSAVVQFNTSEPAYVTIKDGAATTTQGTADNADVAITMEDDDLVALMNGELNGMTAFMTGKLQLEGDMMLAQRVPGFFDKSKLG